MTPGNEPRPRIDDTFAAVVAGLPADLRREAEHLPYRLGLTRSPSGAWEDFVVMDPNRDLPRYAAEDPARPGHCRLAVGQLFAYRRAHHCAAVYGLIADRIADGQVAKSRVFVRLRDEVLRAWIRALGVATGSPPRARALVGAALRATEWGNARERRALVRARRRGEGTLSAREYFTFTSAKLRWFGATAHGLLLSLGEPGRAGALRRTYDIFSIALQCIDDALDDASDRRTRGASFPLALGLPSGGLLAAAPGLIGRAASLARAARFHEFGLWLERVAATLERWPIPGDPLQSSLAAAVLQAAAEEVHHG
ncbi:hypothetical protein [Sorangium cellulosum]|uniref:Uncharacterized protein n=1 Tax=Sorangium cellulosum So0157-2 TaxID=1254432 RepID=A0A0G2YCU4_SORCE|nr:hypothetical protein [Sorangium cellulosum]AKI82216.1 hypothetical protein [Sorangium cellulosum So0157-2]